MWAIIWQSYPWPSPGLWGATKRHLLDQCALIIVLLKVCLSWVLPPAYATDSIHYIEPRELTSYITFCYLLYLSEHGSLQIIPIIDSPILGLLDHWDFYPLPRLYSLYLSVSLWWWNGVLYKLLERSLEILKLHHSVFSHPSDLHLFVW